jgi:tetraacyldisaccharide 4'-kinase
MEQIFLDIVSGRSKGVGPALARSSLKALSWGFSLGARLRRRAYDQGWKNAHKAPLPVISIGNLTTGGTGKTPLVIWCAGQLLSAGLKVAVLSRGYGAKGGELNDEGLLIKSCYPELRLYQNPDRIAAAHEASEEGADIALLDDGFQHRRLHRDLDLVVIDASRPFGYGALLPRGLLREPISSIRRADAVLVTRIDSICESRYLEILETLKKNGAPDLIWKVEFQPKNLAPVHASDKNQYPLSWLESKEIIAACGLGNPFAFEQTLSKLGAKIVDRQHFPDHYAYQMCDLEKLVCLGEKAEAVVVTQKDAVKLATLLKQNTKVKLLTLSIEARIDDAISLKQLLLNKIRRDL